MGNVVASKAFLPPYPSYDEQMATLVWATSKLGDRIPCTYWAHARPRFTILFSHGNAEDIGQLNDWLGYMCRTFSVNVLSYDYRGYGLHPGVPTEASCYADVEGAYDLLTKEFKIPPSRIILYGRSIGSGPTCYLGQRLCALARAQSRPSSWLSPSMFCRGVPSGDDDSDPMSAMLPAGFVLQSPIASAIRVVSTTLAMLPVDIFVNVNRIGKIEIPTMIIHGTDDEVVPYWHGTELYAKAGNPYKGAGHNNVECDFMAPLLSALQAFFVHLEAQRQEDEQQESRKRGKKKVEDTDSDDSDDSDDSGEDNENETNQDD
ncbi:alpha/beta hydrolase, putative [Acanthamoeba castellanii str. Neff]|uniref:Alpha/beta hydrolase, putative n=1 Tax=Acanthamoeba castellanii (strain ATCC 30010 / Neff) TaxID=1257118 RepID=L8GKI7_ACACF|nr:alpha/beta hydrolase, putative [Acanthamoeba castellanii str. Neff]ELR13238.1 alpha/beta hydrolase, putative [Acanthamoeba castellanii str. Neff]